MNVVAIIPSLDPDEKLMQVVHGLIDEGFTDLIVVNDGSHEEHMAPFHEAAGISGVTVLTHEVNRGKGRAMKTAFEYILKNRKDIVGVVTVDGDNQHRPADCRKCAEAMLREPGKLWLGVRDFSGENVPLRSRLGNTITRTVMRIACGVGVTDTQTGLRAASADLLPMLCEIPGERYEYETEMLLDLHRAGVGIGEVVIETVYIDQNSTSHFNPLRDSWLVYRMILKYLSASLSSFLIDFALFTLLNCLLASTTEAAARILIATLGARVVSSLYNYFVNRSFVFKDHASVGKSMPRYYLLAAVQAGCSYGLTALLSHVLAASLFWQSGLKLLVDIVLFLFSYQIQMKWVFRGERKSV